MDNKRKYSLILQGGAEYGVCYLGLIDAMFEMDIFPLLKQTIGTSIGGLFAVLISIIKDRSSYDKINQEGGTLNTLFENNIFISLYNAFKKGGFYDIYSVLNQYHHTIENIVGVKNPTLMQCYNINNIACTLVSFDLKSKKSVYFNTFVDPNMRVIDCIAASCNIPIMCQPIYINNHILVDGGVLKDLDFSITDRGDIIDENTISVNLLIPKPNDGYESIVSVAITLVTMAGFNDAKQNVAVNQNRKLLSIQTLTRKLILTTEEKNLERVNAYEISKSMLSTIDITPVKI